jgi:hypothetical protein
MKRVLSLVMTAALVASAAASARAVEVVHNDKLKLDMYGRGQMIGVGQYVPDPYRDHLRVYLFLKQARIGFKGQYEDLFKFDTQFAFGGENANGSNTDLGLLDFVADVPVKKLGEDTVFKIGQFRVPYSREGLADRGYMEYGERSVANLGSYQSRDYGLAIMGTKGVWTGTFGTFSSGGRDVPQRYLPERLGVPYVVTRFGYNDGADEDIYHIEQNPLGRTRTTKAVMFNALYAKDTLIGHSSAIQVRTTDKNLLIDTGFNPYINQGGGPGLGTVGGAQSMQRGDLWFLGGDAVIHHPLGNDRFVNAEAEANWGGYQNRYGVIHIANARAQGDYQQGAYGIGLRYGVLMMDKKSGFLTTSATGTGTTPGAAVNRVISNELGIPIHEITPALSWRIRGHNMKVIADLPIYLNCPLWYDRIGSAVPAGSQPLGAYAFPDPTSTTQNSLLATPGNSTARRTIVQARMMFQFMF